MLDGGNGSTVQDIVVNSGGTIEDSAVVLKADGDTCSVSLVVKEGYDFGPDRCSYTSLLNVATITLDIMVAATLSTWQTRSTPAPTRR